MLRRGRGRPRKHFSSDHTSQKVEQSRTSGKVLYKELTLQRHRILELANASFCSTISKQRRSLRDLKHFARQLGKEALPGFYPSGGILADFRASSQCGHGPVDCNSSGSGDVAPTLNSNLRSNDNDWVGVEVILCGRKASIGEVGSTTSNVCDELRSFIVDPEKEQLCASFSKNLHQVEPELRNEEGFRASQHDVVPSWLSCRQNMTRKRRMNASGGISDCHITALIASLPKTRNHTGEENGLHLCADGGAVDSVDQSFASQESNVNSGQGSSLDFGHEKQANVCMLQRDAIQACPTTNEKAQKRRRNYQDTDVRGMDGVPTGISDPRPPADVNNGKGAGGGLTLMADFLSLEFESSCNSTGMGELGLYVAHPIPTPPFENTLTINAVGEVPNTAADSNRRKEDSVRFKLNKTFPKPRKKYKPRVAKDKPTHNSRLGTKPSDGTTEVVRPQIIRGAGDSCTSHRNYHQEETRIGPVKSTSPSSHAHLTRNAIDENWSRSHSVLCTSCGLEQSRSEAGRIPNSVMTRQEQFEVVSLALANRVLALLGLPLAGESEQDSQASDFVRCYTEAALKKYTDEGNFSLFGSLSEEMTDFDFEHLSAGLEDPLIMTMNQSDPDLLHFGVEEPGLGACKQSNPEDRTMSSFYASTSAGVTKNMLSRLNEMIEQNIQQNANKGVDHNTYSEQRGLKEDMALCQLSSQVQNSDSTAAEISSDLEDSKVCPRNKICPAKTPFHLMTYAQLVAYIKIILANSSEMSPLQLLRHVQEHLVGKEKSQFEELWPMILHPVNSAQLAQLAVMAEIELPQTIQEESQNGGASHLEEQIKKPDDGTKAGNSFRCQLGESIKRCDFSSCKDIIQYRQDYHLGNSCLEVIPYNQQSDLTALVPYVSKVGDSILVYDGPFFPLRKRKPRPKVYLDSETIRVWKLLMGKTEATESDPDIDNELKWKQERLLMQEQAVCFIRRMHSIQGDRSFSRWKGSVVDSVVGVFLTQNVSDVLSSSAFMYLRARFPIQKPVQSKPLGENFEDTLQDNNPAPLQMLEEPQILCSYEASSDPATREQPDTSFSESHASLTSECQQVDYILTEQVMMSSQLKLLLQQNAEKVLAVELTGIERARMEAEQVYARKSLKWEALAEKYDASFRRDLAPQPLEITEDGVDWEAVRCADLEDIADAIKDRGMNWKLAGRIKGFLERLRQEQGGIDLEWLRSIPSDDAKEFLSSIHGLGLKSVECIRLLALHHSAFPVDTNVGRICVRLGWVPLEPLPEELQLHVLELYPVQATIQKYLWPRLCTLDQQTLYELHYQLITFGKVFCTKSKPNCNACPMRSDCKHFASALSSAKAALPASDIASENGSILALQSGNTNATEIEESPPKTVHSSMCMSQYCQPIIEEPMTPESEADLSDCDIEDYPFSVEEIEPTMDIYRQKNHLNLSEIARDMDIEDSETLLALEPKVVSTLPEMVVNCAGENTTNVLTRATVLFGDAPSRDVVMLPPEAASIPVPKLKNIERLRTVHYVYELPDNHPLLDGMDMREVDDPCFYLLAIWSLGEVPESIPNINDDNEESTFASCNFSCDEESIKGTLLVPCRTAMQGSFPLNGTYFQVNEVFADHQSSLQPIQVPRVMLWNLRRRYVYFGTSVTSILRGMTAEEIKACFRRGYVCVRGFDRMTRAPKPLVSRLHFQTTKAISRNAPIKTTKT